MAEAEKEKIAKYLALRICRHLQDLLATDDFDRIQNKLEKDKESLRDDLNTFWLTEQERTLADQDKNEIFELAVKNFKSYCQEVTAEAIAENKKRMH